MYQSSARPPPSAVCILIKRAALIPASQNHHNRVVSCPGSGGPRFSQQNPRYFFCDIMQVCLAINISKLTIIHSSNIGWLGLNGPSGPLKPRPCGLLRGFALSLTGFTSLSCFLFAYLRVFYHLNLLILLIPLIMMTNGNRLTNT